MPTAQLRDILMHYEEAGSGDALVLVNDLGGDSQAWALAVPELSKHLRVVTLDNRGAGRTSAPDRPYSIAGMAEDVNALLGQIGVAKAHVLGHGMGGFIAQELAASHPERVNRLILLASAAEVEGYVEAIVRSAIDIRRSSMSREQGVRAMAPLLYSPALLDDAARLDRAVLNALRNPVAQQDHAFIRQAQALLQWEGGRAAAIKSPTLVIAGEDDVFFPARNTEKLAKAIPSATLATLPGGHVGAVEYPHEYNTAILEFLGALGAKQEAEAAAV